MTSKNALKSNDNSVDLSGHERPSLGVSCCDWREGQSGWGMCHDSLSGQTTDWAKGLADLRVPAAMTRSNLWIQYLHKSFVCLHQGQFSKLHVLSEESRFMVLSEVWLFSFLPSLLSFIPSLLLLFSLQSFFLSSWTFEEVSPYPSSSNLPASAPEFWGYRCVIPRTVYGP